MSKAKQKLTDREYETLRLMVQGLSNAEIAKQMIISPHTVKAHLESIYQKFNVKNKVQATVFAVYHEIINPFEC